ncbi:MAG: flagellar export chaperone FlgN [Chthonomonas sp.]|nr:flagellar export chaperone FlgN [Chthonomonas sp.]
MMKSRHLQTQWWDWLGTSERLMGNLREQTRALVSRDVGAVERIQAELDSMLTRMREIDEQAAVSARKLADELGVDPTLRSLVGALSQAEAQQVQSLANRVRAAAASLETSISKNRKLIENEMTYVNGTLALIAKSAQEQNAKYGGPSTAPAVLVDQVA